MNYTDKKQSIWISEGINLSTYLNKLWLKKTLLIVLFAIAIGSSKAQVYHIDFSVSGNVTNLDSIQVENLNNGDQITVLGNDTVKLTLLPTDIAETYPHHQDNQIKIYPNPFIDYTYAEFDLVIAGKIKLSVFNVVGKLIVAKQLNLPSGQHTVKISGLKFGTYFLQIEGNNLLTTNTFIGLDYQQNGKPGIEQISSSNKKKEHNKPASFRANTLKLVYEFYINYNDAFRYKGYANNESQTVVDVPSQSETIDFYFNEECGNSTGIISLNSSAALLMQNGSFDNGLNSWSATSVDPEIVVFDTLGHQNVLKIRVDSSLPVGWYQLYQSIACDPGAVFQLDFDIAAFNIQNGVGAYVAVSYYNQGSGLISTDQSNLLTNTSLWDHHVIPIVTPANCDIVDIALILHGHGLALFDNLCITNWYSMADTTTAEMIIVDASGLNGTSNLLGIGAEDDGWIFNAENQQLGLTPTDIQIREDRIVWMDLDFIRMFFWREDWNPSGDWITFDFNTPNMQSHYACLDLYDSIGSIVNVTGVEWISNPPYQIGIDTIANAIGELLEHLINVKGYTCIKQWTLQNEPNLAFPFWAYDFSTYRDINLAVKQEFTDRLLNIDIVGSDEAVDLNWFTESVEDSALFQAVDYFASHAYFTGEFSPLPSFFNANRLEVLNQQQQIKPLIITEYGFGDSCTTGSSNPIMHNYDYALYTMDYIINCLNQGVEALSIWTLHTVYYPGNNYMDYGLWDYSNDSIRPVYHAVAAFTKNSESGDVVYKCSSTYPQIFNATRIEDMIFWVNKGSTPMDVKFTGLTVDSVRIMTEPTLTGDQECGYLVLPVNSSFEVPAYSFGYGYCTP